ncbi:MAG: diguanylate cyclase [Candidatus Omnitrophica bacterium]|nr:diguanylate cyclase [Candidatus Omnitrophota bacterium]
MEHKILVVEDNTNDLETLKNKLKNEPYELIHAPDGKSAFLLLEREKPDLIILDVLLPDTDGFEICRRIRKSEQHVSLPILFHTTVNTTDEKLIGLEMGASDFLNKNSDERELIVRIRNLLNLKKTIDNQIKFSVIDSLTTVYNKTYFHHRISDELARGRRYKRNFCCAIIDVDYFKQVNDLFGYVTGDMVLKKLAAIFLQNIRGADILCRYGGDEFAWLLPETEMDDAYLAVERMRQFVVTSELGKDECRVSLTISCGLSCLEDVCANKAEEIFANALNALNKAKAQGRNQTRVYGKEKEH